MRAPLIYRVNPIYEESRQKAEAAGQGHLFAHWGGLKEAQRQTLLECVSGIDFDQVQELGALLDVSPRASPTPEFEPPHLFPLRRDSGDENRAHQARGLGRELLARGHVGYLLVAGGQGSRLGMDGPKGCYPIGPVSGISLFALHARRLLAAQRLYGAPTPWYVMTSPANDQATREFFEAEEHFGLSPADVFFFCQDVLPVLGLDGRILMEAPERPSLAPNGHGGVLPAVLQSGALDDMQARGLRHISYFQVDNPLVRPADPLFLGLHALEGAEMSSKAVEKREVGEKVGVIGRINGQLGCIEYSDLPESLRRALDAEGRLAFCAGNIAVHAIDVSFMGSLNGAGPSLPWHIARKNVRALDDEGQVVDRPGVKFETFVFDALGHAKKSVTLEVDRGLEFSPVKNGEGDDSPASARAAMCRLHAGWAKAAGRSLPGADADGLVRVEVDPLFAEDSDEFQARGPMPAEVIGDGHLYI